MDRLFPRFRGQSAAVLLLALCSTAAANAADRPDLIVADFEGDDYGRWTVTGNAFGHAPAWGALPGQMEVSGFLGKRLVSSFNGGDDSTGTLTSPEFTVERPRLSFLVGGGGYPGETCVNLLQNGKVVRTATGPNDKPGGSERLDWATWDVSDLVGTEVKIQIVDGRKGGWGHINVDQIVQGDSPRGLVWTDRQFRVDSHYLNFPVQTASPSRRVTVTEGKTTAREFDIRLAEGKPDFWVACDVSPFRGRTLKVGGKLPDAGLSAVAPSDTFPGGSGLYREWDRPRFHFTSRRGWLNDPNGLVWKDGAYHLFYQHNPYGWDWGNMHWGHAVSPDLVHWKELGEAIYPHAYGDWAFSGSAVVDHQNTSGWSRDGKPALVAAYTSTGRGECVVYSHDDGRTFTEYEKNPVVRHTGRDPRLVWHGPTKRWVMAVYDEAEGKRWINFYSSPDLKAWKYESRIGGFFECPDLFEIASSEGPKVSAWVLYGADGEYLVGDFDGRVFTPRGDPSKKHKLWYGKFYAAQTFSNAPDGRRIQVGWASGITFPDMPFNQQMNVPVELTLRSTDDGPRLFARPVKELNSLRDGARQADARLSFGYSDAFDMEVVARVPAPHSLTVNVCGTHVSIDAKAGTLKVGDVTAPLSVRSRPVDLRILGDRRSIEVFADRGAVAVSVPFDPSPKDDVSLVTNGSEVLSTTFHPLKSSWETPPRR